MWLFNSIPFHILWVLYGSCYALNSTDIYARFYLMQLWSQTGGPSWAVTTQWGASEKLCDWPGVSCCLRNAAAPYSLSYTLQTQDGMLYLQRPCRRESEVMALALMGFNLQGELPVSVSQMTLEVLLLADNPGLYGTLPRAVLEFENLLLVDVRNTSLTCDSSSTGVHASSASSSMAGQLSAADAACGLPARYAFGELGHPESGGSDILPPGATYACAKYSFRNDSSAPAPGESSVVVAPEVRMATTELITTPLGAAPWLAAGATAGSVTVLLSSPGFWHYQSCICMQLPGGRAAAPVPPTLSLSANGGVMRVTCRENGTVEAAATSDSHLGNGAISPSIFAGVLAAVGVATAVLTAVCMLIFAPALLRRRSIGGGWRFAPWGHGGARTSPRHWHRSWAMETMPSTFERCSDDLMATDEPLAASPFEGNADGERGLKSCRTTGLGTSGSGPGGEAVMRLQQGAGRSTRVPPPLPSMDTKRAHAPGFGALSGEEVTLVATDVEGSTELWEWQPDVMNHALALHDRLMRLTIATCCGYEITTEGDAFLVAFHDPVDAVRWALLLQSALLKLDWPPLLLEHPLCRPRPLVPVAPMPPIGAHGGASASAPLLVLFKGLSVRMGIATGVPSSVREHPVTRRMQYTGAILRLATGIAELGSGGQVLVEPMTFKGIHNKIEELDVVEAEVQELADVVRHDTTIMRVGTPVKQPLQPEESSDADAPPMTPSGQEHQQQQHHHQQQQEQQQQQQQQNQEQPQGKEMLGSTITNINGGAPNRCADAPAQITQIPALEAQHQSRQQLVTKNLSGGIPRSNTGTLSTVGAPTTAYMGRLTPHRFSPEGRVGQMLPTDTMSPLSMASPTGVPGTTSPLFAQQPGASPAISTPLLQHAFTANSSRLRRLADMALPSGMTSGTGFAAPLCDLSGQSSRLPAWAPAWQVPSHRALMIARNSGAPPNSSTHNASDWNASHAALLVSRGSFVSHIQTMSCSNGSRSGANGTGTSTGPPPMGHLGVHALGDSTSPFLNFRGSNATAVGSSHSGSMMLQRTTSFHGVGQHGPGQSNLDNSATFGGTWRAVGGRLGLASMAPSAGDLMPPTEKGLMQPRVDHEPSFGLGMSYSRGERTSAVGRMVMTVLSPTGQRDVLPSVADGEAAGLLWSGRSTPVSGKARAAVAAAMAATVASAATGSTSTSTMSSASAGTGGEVRGSGQHAHDQVMVVAAVMMPQAAVPQTQPSPAAVTSARRGPGPLCEALGSDDNDATDAALLASHAPEPQAAGSIGEVGVGGTFNLTPSLDGDASSGHALTYEAADVDTTVYPPHVARAITAGSADSQSHSNPSIPSTRCARGSAMSATLGLHRVRGHDSGNQHDEDEELYLMLLEAPSGWSGYGASEGNASNGGGGGGGTGAGTSSGSRSQVRSPRGAAGSLSTSTSTAATESGKAARRLRNSSNVRVALDSLQVDSLALGIGPGVGMEASPLLGAVHPRASQPSPLTAPADSFAQDEDDVGSTTAGVRGHLLRNSVTLNPQTACGSAHGSNFLGPAPAAAGCMSTSTFGSWIIPNPDAVTAAGGRLSMELQRLTLSSAAGLSSSAAPDPLNSNVNGGMGSQLGLETVGAIAGAEAANMDPLIPDAQAGGVAWGGGGSDFMDAIYHLFKSAPQERVIRRMSSGALISHGSPGTIVESGCSGADAVVKSQGASGEASTSTPTQTHTAGTAATENTNVTTTTTTTTTTTAGGKETVINQRHGAGPDLFEPVKDQQQEPPAHNHSGKTTASSATDVAKRELGVFSVPPLTSGRRAGGLQRSAASFTAHDRKSHLGGPHVVSVGAIGSGSSSPSTSIVGSLGKGAPPGGSEFSFAISRLDTCRPSNAVSSLPAGHRLRDLSFGPRGLATTSTDSNRALLSPTVEGPGLPAGEGPTARHLWQPQQKDQQPPGSSSASSSSQGHGEQVGSAGGSSATEGWAAVGGGLRPALPVVEAAGSLPSNEEHQLLRRAPHSTNKMITASSVPPSGLMSERHRLASASTAVEWDPERGPTAPRLTPEQVAGGLYNAPSFTVSNSPMHTSTPGSPALVPSQSGVYRVVRTTPILSQARGSSSAAPLELRSAEDIEGGFKASGRGGPAGCGMQILSPTWMARPVGMGPALTAGYSGAGPMMPLNPSECAATAICGMEHNIRAGSAAATQFVGPMVPSGATVVGGPTSSSSLLVGTQTPVVPTAVMTTGGALGAAAVGPPGGAALLANPPISTTAMASPVLRTDEGLMGHIPPRGMYHSLSGDEAFLLPSTWQDMCMQVTPSPMGLMGALQVGAFGQSQNSTSPAACASPYSPMQYFASPLQYSSQHSHKLPLLGAPHGNPKVLALREMLGREAGVTSLANHAAKQAKDLAEDDELLERGSGLMVGSVSNLTLPDHSTDKPVQRRCSGGGVRDGLDTCAQSRFARSGRSGVGDSAKRTSGGVRSSNNPRPRHHYLTTLRPDAVPERPESEADAISSPPRESRTPSGRALALIRPNGKSNRADAAVVGLHTSRPSYELARPESQMVEIELVTGSGSTSCMQTARDERDRSPGSGTDSGIEMGTSPNAGLLSALSIPRFLGMMRESRDSSVAAAADVASSGSSPHFRRLMKRTKSRSALIKSLASRQGGGLHRQLTSLSALKGSKFLESDESMFHQQEGAHSTYKLGYGGRVRINKRDEERNTAGAGATVGYHPLVVIDMGVHSLAIPALDMMYSNLYDGVQVIQLLPAHLKHRAAYHPPLRSQAQLAPGFFDAPGAAQALLPCPPSQPPSFPRLSLMFIQPAGYSSVANANLEVAERSGAVFCAAVREVLQMYGAYECQEYECTFMVACAGPRIAAEAGLALQEWLLQADWPSDLLDEFESGRVVMGPSGRPLLRGFRAKVGIFTGVPLSVVPHATTGRADYFGAMVNRAARLMAGAKAGQILVDKNCGLEAVREWRQMLAAAPAGSPDVGSDVRSSRLTPLPLPATLRDPRVRGSSLGPNLPLSHRGSTNGSSLNHCNNVTTTTTTGAGIGNQNSNNSGSGFYALAKMPPPSPPAMAAALQLAPSWLVPITWPVGTPDGVAATRNIASSGVGNGDRPAVSASDTQEHGNTGGGGGSGAGISASAVANTSASVPASLSVPFVTPFPDSDGRIPHVAHGGSHTAIATGPGVSNPLPATAPAIMAATAAGKASLLHCTVQVVDLGEFKLKGLQRGQPVVALQLRRIAGQPGDALLQEEGEISRGKENSGGGGKAQQVQRGTGLIDELAVALALPAGVLAACPDVDIDAA